MDPFGGDAIEGRGADDWVAGGTCVREGLIVGNREKEIRARLSAALTLGERQGGARCEEFASTHGSQCREIRGTCRRAP